MPSTVARRGVNQLCQGCAPVAPLFVFSQCLSQCLIETHLAEQPAVTGPERDAGPGHRVAEHLLAEGPPGGGHVVDAHADIRGRRDVAGIAPSTHRALADPHPAGGSTFRCGPAEQRAVGHLACQPEHVRTERLPEQRPVAAGAQTKHEPP